jgi:uncharacterized membrane-anchored protein YitT (DUF2179 family)
MGSGRRRTPSGGTPKAARPRGQRPTGRQVAAVLWDYAVIAVGAILTALATDLFFVPNRVVVGGVVGIGTLLHYLANAPVGLVTLLCNVPLFVAGVIWGGGLRAGLRTACGVLVMSAAIDLLAPHLPALQLDPMLYIVYGGLLDGLGMGLVFRAGGTTGGIDIVARLLNRFFGIGLGRTLLAANVLILGAAGLVFGLEPALYAIIVAYASSRVVDLVQEGMTRSRAALINSSHTDEIRTAIFDELGRGVTLLYGQGGYTRQERPVLLCAVSQAEEGRLLRLVQRVDPGAFVIVIPASQVLGEGFLTTTRR